MDPVLVITRGYPASGKSSWAREWAGTPGRARVNRDDLRALMFGQEGVLSANREQQVTVAQRAQVQALLRAGVSVVVDDTNLRAAHARAWADLALVCGADFEVEDFPVPAAECIDRDARRGEAGGRRVGAEVIADLAARYPIRSWPPVTPTTAPAFSGRYRGTPGRPAAWIVDLDGTLADHSGRNPYDTGRAGADLLIEPVADLVRALGREHEIVVTSGREETFRAVTEQWLREVARIEYAALLLRPAGDQRPDDVVKAEIFHAAIAPHWDVRGCVDDRNRVVDMWRALGLTCAQVAPGDF